MTTWNINGDQLTFDEAIHQYYLNGIKCVSVTQLIKFKFPNKYKDIDPNVLEQAARRGTELHESIELFEKMGLEDSSVELRNYKFLKKMFKWETIDCEVPVILKYKDIVVCGRLDQIIKIDDNLGIVDIKRTSVLDKEYLAYQLNLYRMAYIQTYGVKVDTLKAIHLRESERKFINIPIKEESCIDLLEEFRKENTWE